MPGLGRRLTGDPGGWGGGRGGGGGGWSGLQAEGKPAAERHPTAPELEKPVGADSEEDPPTDTARAIDVHLPEHGLQLDVGDVPQAVLHDPVAHLLERQEPRAVHVHVHEQPLRLEELLKGDLKGSVAGPLGLRPRQERALGVAPRLSEIRGGGPLVWS
jgi:hypothetical protein